MLFPSLITTLLALCLVLTGCGGGNDTYNPTLGGGPASSFTLTVAPPSATVTQGQAATYTATVTGVNGFSGPVSLSVSGLPENATAQFVPPVVTPTANGATSTLTVATGGADAPGNLQGTIRSRAISSPGTYTLTIIATSGGVTRRATVQLIVAVAGTPMFALAAAPPSQSVAAGGATTYAVTVTGSNGFSNPVDLSVTGLPSGATGSFSPTQVAPNATGATSTLTVTTVGSTPTGTSPLTITGTSGSLTNQASVTLTVTGTIGGGTGVRGYPSDSAVDSTGRFLYVAQQGDIFYNNGTFTGDVRQFKINSDGTLTPLAPPSLTAGGVSQPLSIGAHPTLPFVYVANTGGTISQFRVGELGQLVPLSAEPVRLRPGDLSPQFPDLGYQYLRVDPGGLFVFSISHNPSGSVVTSLRINPDGTLTELNHGRAVYLPVGITATPRLAGGQQYVYTASRRSGFLYPPEIRTFRVDTNGTLTDAGTLSLGDFEPLSLTASPDGSYLFATRSNFGNAPPSVLAYRINAADGSLTALSQDLTAAGSAPITTDPSGRFVYTPGSGSVEPFRVNADGTLSPLASVSVTAPGPISSLRVHPNGQFLYATNLGGIDEAIVSVYRLNADGTLTPL